MEPSSLVFVAIIGVWAAYLIPTLLRRRMLLAQSRAGDRFSAGARVLDRRPARVAAGRPSSDAVHARRVAEPAGTGARPVVAPPAARGGTGAAGAAALARAVKAERAARAIHEDSVLRCHSAAIRRAQVLAGLSGLTAVAWAVSWMSASPAWVALPVTALLVLQVLAGRMAAVRGRDALAADRDRVEVARHHRVSLERAAAAADAARRAAPAERPAATVEPAVAVGGEPWVPVPVPPPTYTLKPAVHRPEPAPLPETERPAARERRSGHPDRRRATGRGALPRRAEDIERILDLEELDQRTAATG